MTQHIGKTCLFRIAANGRQAELIIDNACVARIETDELAVVDLSGHYVRRISTDAATGGKATTGGRDEYEICNICKRFLPFCEC